MKPKEWLLKNGHIKEITRGRMSRENISLIENAVRAGTVIEGYSVTRPSTAAVNKETVDSKVQKVALKGDRIADVPDEARPESQWEAHTVVDGKRRPVGMRTVCNTCRNSLTYCYCPQPLVTIDQNMANVVVFTNRSTPLPVRKW